MTSHVNLQKLANKLKCKSTHKNIQNIFILHCGSTQYLHTYILTSESNQIYILTEESTQTYFRVNLHTYTSTIACESSHTNILAWEY